MAAGPTRCWTGSRGGSGGSSTGGSGGRGGQTARGARVHTGFGLACGPGGVIVLVRRLVAGGPRLGLRLPRLLDLGPELRALLVVVEPLVTVRTVPLPQLLGGVGERLLWREPLVQPQTREVLAISVVDRG